MPPIYFYGNYYSYKEHNNTIWWWHHNSSSLMMQSRKLSPLALYWFNRSWQICIWCSFWFYVILFLSWETPAFPMLLPSFLTMPIFSSTHSSLIIIWFVWMSWSRRASFCGGTAVHGHPEHGFSVTLLSLLLKCTTHPSLCSHPLFCLQKCSASVDECQGAMLRHEVKLTS